MDQTFHAIIEVVNRATAPLRAIDMDLAGVAASLHGVALAGAQLGEITGIATVARQAENAVSKVANLGRAISGLAVPLLGIGAIASIGGILNVAKETAEFGKKLETSSLKTGVEIPVLARLHYVAKHTETDPEALDKGLFRLNTNLFNARTGKNKQLAGFFEHFVGPHWKSEVTDAGVALGVLAGQMQKHHNAATRAGIASMAFGARTGQTMIPMLMLGKDALRKLGDEFERYNGKWDKSRIERAVAVADDWERLEAAGQGLAMTIGSAVAPALQKIIEPLTEWVAKNRELVAAKANDAIKAIGDALKNTDWKGIGDAVRSVGNAVKYVADTIGTKGAVIAGLGLLFAPIIGPAIEAAIAIGELGIAAVIAAGRIGILVGMSVFGFFADLVTGINLALPALASLDLALDANPIGAVVLGIAALAAGAYLIYKNWEPISEWFKDLWAGITHAVQAAWSHIKPIVDKIAAAMKWVASHSGLQSFMHSTSDVATRQRQKNLEAAKRAGGNVSRVMHGFSFSAADIPVFGPLAAGVGQLHDIGAQDRAAAAARTQRLATGGRRGGDDSRAVTSSRDGVRAPLIDTSRANAAALAGILKPARGEVDVTVDFKNLPRGVETTASGNDGVKLAVGKSWERK